MTTYRLMDGVSGRPGVGSSGTQPPATVTSASGGWLLGSVFVVTPGMRWLDGYYLWLPSNGDLVTYTFALWNPYANGSQALVTGSTVSSGSLARSTFNSIPLSSPIQLAPGEIYVAAVGFTASAGIPLTSGQFGSGDPYPNGIVNGPVTMLPNTGSGGTNLFPWSSNWNLPGGGVFSNVLGADPTAAMPNNASGADLFWLDVVIDDTAPATYAGSYRLHPGSKNLGPTSNVGPDTANNFTLGVEFSLSQACAVDYVWFYSPPGVGQLPTSIGIFQVSGPTLVASNSSPSWSGVAGSGWVKATLPGTTLLSGVNYKVAVCNGAGSPVIWNDFVQNYWNPGGGNNGGFGGNGLTAGPLSFPNTSGAVSPGQASYNPGATLTYPTTNVGPYDYGVDIEVTPIALGSGTLLAAFP